jgi:DNA-binding NarL/FixJ family response regulator
MFALTSSKYLELVQQIALSFRNTTWNRPTTFGPQKKRASRRRKAGRAGMKRRDLGMTTTEIRATDRDMQMALGGLTPTQMKVLEGVNSGLLNKQIAFDLGIAEATVKAHMTALMRKLNVHNRTQAAIAAQSLVQGLRSAAS